MSWSHFHSFTLERGITLVSYAGGEREETHHFKTVRPLLKHLRESYPHLEFKSEKWNYYGVNYTIKARVRGVY